MVVHQSGVGFTLAPLDRFGSGPRQCDFTPKEGNNPESNDVHAICNPEEPVIRTRGVAKRMRASRAGVGIDLKLWMRPGA